MFVDTIVLPQMDPCTAFPVSSRVTPGRAVALLKGWMMSAHPGEGLRPAKRNGIIVPAG